MLDVLSCHLDTIEIKDRVYIFGNHSIIEILVVLDVLSCHLDTIELKKEGVHSW